MMSVAPFGKNVGVTRGILNYFTYGTRYPWKQTEKYRVYRVSDETPKGYYVKYERITWYEHTYEDVTEAERSTVGMVESGSKFLFKDEFTPGEDITLGNGFSKHTYEQFNESKHLP